MTPARKPGCKLLQNKHAKKAELRKEMNMARSHARDLKLDSIAPLVCEAGDPVVLAAGESHEQYPSEQSLASSFVGLSWLGSSLAPLGKWLLG